MSENCFLIQRHLNFWIITVHWSMLRNIVDFKFCQNSGLRVIVQSIKRWGCFYISWKSSREILTKMLISKYVNDSHKQKAFTYIFTWMDVSGFFKMIPCQQIIETISSIWPKSRATLVTNTHTNLSLSLAWTNCAPDVNRVLSGKQNLWDVPVFLGAHILPCEK